MRKILSFGGGVQTTALAIMAAKGEIEVDEVVFADTGAEKPETYWYMENYTKPMLKEAEIQFTSIIGADPTHKIQRNLVEHCYHYKTIPSVSMRWCTAQSKSRPIDDYKGEAISLIGFSWDEAHRAKNRQGRRYPLIELGLTGADCQRIISDYGWPIPTKSSCFFCPYQRPVEWNWLKLRHPELIEKALAMEQRFYERRPDKRNEIGLLGGRPLWKWAEGIQGEFDLQEYSCWSGHCGH